MSELLRTRSGWWLPRLSQQIKTFQSWQKRQNYLLNWCYFEVFIIISRRSTWLEGSKMVAQTNSIFNIQENICARVSFSKKLHAGEIALRCRCFSLNFHEIFYERTIKDLFYKHLWIAASEERDLLL